MPPSEFAKTPIDRIHAEFREAYADLNREVRRPPSEIDSARIAARMRDFRIAQTALLRRTAS
jgi:hypothetical protein